MQYIQIPPFMLEYEQNNICNNLKKFNKFCVFDFPKIYKYENEKIDYERKTNLKQLIIAYNSVIDIFNKTISNYSENVIKICGYLGKEKSCDNMFANKTKIDHMDTSFSDDDIYYSPVVIKLINNIIQNMNMMYSYIYEVSNVFISKFNISDIDISSLNKSFALLE